MFLAFTGTPLIACEERTKEVFGNYVSIYDFQQSVEDGATLPLFYENRTPELQLVNPDLNEDIYNLIEQAELDPEQEAKLERELSGQQRLQRVDDAVNALISPDSLRREFFGHERLVNTFYGAVKPDPAALEFAGRVACLAAIADAIRTKLNPNPADISEVMGDIGKLLDASITGVAMPTKAAPLMDLSKIDFVALGLRFKESKHKNTDLEVLKAAIRAQQEKLIRLNKTRADFTEKFEELIESYNAGSRNLEELFEELLKLSRNLSDEQQRHVRENMNEEELVIFDIVTRPAPEFSADERAELKKVSRELLTRIKQLLVINWRQKSTARSQLKLAIEDTLDTELPSAFTRDLYQQKCSAVFEHFYESYTESGSSFYATGA